MAIKDEDRSVRVEPRPKKKRRSVAPVMGEQASGGSKVPAPRPVYQAPQVFGDDWGPNTNNIFDLNRRAGLAASSYQSIFGVDPSPGLLYDLVRSPVPNEEYAELLKVPTSFAQARAQAEASQADPADQIEALPVIQGMKQAIQQDAPGTSENFDAYVEEHAEELNALAAENSAEFEFVVEKLQKERSTEQGQPALQLAGPGAIAKNSWVLLPFTAAAQISEALVYAPVGAVEVAKSLGYDAAAAKSGDFSFDKSRALGGQIVEGVKETYSNPMENPGFIFMDFLGLTAGGAGAVSRVSRASKAARAGEGTRGVLNALSRRGLPGRFELGGEDKLLSQNVSYNALQKVIYERKQRALDKRKGKREGDLEPLPASSFSRARAEATVGREAAARQRVEKTLAEEPVRSLEAVRGWAINSARAFSSLPNAMRRGMSRGEQKALQIWFTDEPGGWEEKLALHRSFHEKMIENGVGYKKEHERQLADIALAEKVFEKPGKRFDEAVSLVDEVSLEGELLKIKSLGLDENAARARVANYARALRGENLLDDATPLTDTARYIPSVPSTRASRVGRIVSGRRFGPMGLPMPRGLPELSHQFTGKSVWMGNTRIDTTNLVGESYARAVRLATALDEHKRLWALSSEKRHSEWDIAIRSTEDIPDELRDIATKADSHEGVVTKKDIDGLDENFQNSLYKHLFPDTNIGKGVRWVDSRLIGNAAGGSIDLVDGRVVWRPPGRPGPTSKVFSYINEPFRLGMYLRPGYGVNNILGNSGMLLMQNFGSANTMRKAIRINKRYGEKNARSIAALVGEGKSMSFTPEDFISTRLTKTIAKGWSHLVDQKFREASFIHWAERMGYKDEESMTRLLDPKNVDEKIGKELVEITRRAKKDMVEFDNLTNFEKDTMRHLVFVYPWVSRSIVWGLRTMVEHPLKTWSLAELGKIGEGEAAQDYEKWAREQMGDEEYERLEKMSEGDIPVPDWFKNSGYFPLYADENGLPKFVNLQSINSFTGIGELLRAGRSIVDAQPYDGPEDYSSPALEFSQRLLSGRNDFGTEYDNRLRGAVEDAIATLPQVAALRRNDKVPEDAKPSERPSFLPGGLSEVLGPLILGGLWGRTPDTEAMASDWMREVPQELKNSGRIDERKEAILNRLALERKSIYEAEKANSEILGRPLPQEVREAIDFQMRVAQAYVNAALGSPYDKAGNVKPAVDPSSGVGNDLKGVSPDLGLGRDLTPLEKRIIDIQALSSLGRIGDDTKEELTKAATKAANKGEIGKWSSEFQRDYLNAKAVADWYDDRDAVLDFATNAEAYLSDLRQAGLYKGGQGKPKQTDLYAVGREYVRYDRQKNAREDETGPRSDLRTLDNSLDRAWIDAQDKPVKVDGKVFPSPVRVDWAMMSDEQRLDKIAENATGSWDTLSDFEKELLGKKPAEGTSRGWLALNSIMDAYRGNLKPSDLPSDFPKELRRVLPDALPFDSREIPKEDKIKLAKYVDKNIAKGFYKDYLFSLEPKYHRLSYLPIITESKASKEWKELLGVARSQFAYIRRSRDLNYKVPYTITGIQEEWDAYAKSTLWPYIRKNGSDTFRNEIELLGGVDLLRTLIADG